MAAPATSRVRKKNVKNAFTSGRLLGDGGAGGASQIFVQNDHGGNGIDGVFAVRDTGGFLAAVAGFGVGDAPAHFFLEDALGLPTAQAFIDEFDGKAELLAEALGKTLGFFGHFAGSAV